MAGNSMSKALIMTRKMSRPKAQKRYDHYAKNARKLHAKHCSDPGWCNYSDPENPATADDPALPWPERQRRAGVRLGEMHSCQGAVDAENAAAEIERHLAAIRKIKARGRPLKDAEAYHVYPELKAHGDCT
jgi:hypothetical protein